VPAPIAARHLRDNRVVAEQNDLNSLPFPPTPGGEAADPDTIHEPPGGGAAPRASRRIP
jgi:ornithine decarboxylase